jgi:hypothetical protein
MQATTLNARISFKTWMRAAFLGPLMEIQDGA